MRGQRKHWQDAGAEEPEDDAEEFRHVRQLDDDAVAWLEAEIDRMKPEVIVCLGSTAAQSLLGPSIRIQRDRGREFRAAWASRVMVSYHPSAVLRADDPRHSDEIYAWLVEDLRSAAIPGSK